MYEAICSHEVLLCYNWYVFHQGHRFICRELIRSHQINALKRSLRMCEHFSIFTQLTLSPSLLPPSFICLLASSLFFPAHTRPALFSSCLCHVIHLMRLPYIWVGFRSGDLFYISPFLELSRATASLFIAKPNQSDPPPTTIGENETKWACGHLYAKRTKWICCFSMQIRRKGESHHGYYPSGTE